MTTIACPLIDRTTSTNSCSGCMYRATDGSCLHGVSDTTEYARSRGVRPADVDVERVKAESRIQAGLLLYEYHSWFRRLALPVPETVDPTISQLLDETPLAGMGVSAGELVALAQPEIWEHFVDEQGVDTDFRLAQVLLLTEQQYTVIEDRP